MTADQRLALIRLEVERADKHILDLNANPNLLPNPYEVSTKRDPETGKLVHYMVRAAPALLRERPQLDPLSWGRFFWPLAGLKCATNLRAEGSALFFWAQAPCRSATRRCSLQQPAFRRCRI